MMQVFQIREEKRKLIPAVTHVVTSSLDLADSELGELAARIAMAKGKSKAKSPPGSVLAMPPTPRPTGTSQYPTHMRGELDLPCIAS